MERADKIGTWVSGVVHAGIILWAVVGDLLIKRDPVEPIQMTQVSVISDAEFQAMQAAAPKAGEVQDTAPEAIAAPQQDSSPAEDVPAPDEAPDPAPQAALAEPVAKPEAKPDLSEVQTPAEPTEVTEVPPSMMPDVEVPQDTSTPEFSPRPVPKPARRVAPDPLPTPAPEAKVAEVPKEATQEAEAPKPEEPKEEAQEAAAPEEAGTEIETEASKPVEEAKTSAPPVSPKPRTKPAPPKKEEPKPVETAAADTPKADTPKPVEKKAEKPADKPAAKPVEKKADKPAAKPAEKKTEKPAAAAKPAAPSPNTEKAVQDALAQALGGEGTGGTGNAPMGPPITRGEKEALVVDVKQCWNVGALSSEALRTTVTVSVQMNQNGTPIISTIKMIGSSGGSDAAAKQAFEAARRAIVRCGSDGFPLPAEKYGRWKTIEMDFNPDSMRMR
ncbi:hypothetical protein [Thioclava sp. GXIMD4215]|uniref:hypothetical protein n=1 Tax=Thioclava sp. GXIMD4215 TaxID=3131928 RepID=UPI003244CEE0